MRDVVAATFGWHDADQHARFVAAFDPSITRMVELDGTPIGLLKVDARGTPVRLLQLAVAPEFQGRGLGTALVRRVIAEAGTRPVWLQVLHANPRARALYARLGFVAIGRTDTHVRMWRSAGWGAPTTAA